MLILPKNMRLSFIVLTLIPAFTVAFEPFSTVYLAGAAASAIGGYFFYNYDPCATTECCQHPWVNSNPYLDFHNIYGQPLVQRIVHDVIMKRRSYARPLLLSFHGPVGTGKTHLSTLLSDRIFQKGKESQYVHFLSVGFHFPNPEDIWNYHEKLKSIIIESLKKCPKSIFIFDEFEKMPPKLVRTIASFVEPRATIGRVHTDEAIFILLSNTGSKAIVKKTYEQYKNNVDREDFKLGDFEEEIKLAVFNEPGAYRDSDLIKKELVDAYIPFLPLEKEHVRRCIISEYIRFYGHEPTESNIENVLKGIKFSQDMNHLYAETGCKKVLALVARGDV